MWTTIIIFCICIAIGLYYFNRKQKKLTLPDSQRDKLQIKRDNQDKQLDDILLQAQGMKKEQLELGKKLDSMPKHSSWL
jgi:hypothetical protein